MTRVLLVRWIIAGLLATLAMDLGSTLLRSTGLIAGLSPHLIGRWFASRCFAPLTFASPASGRPVAGTIDAMPAVSGEVPIALAMHYSIGVALTLVFGSLLAITHARAAPRGAFALAIGFGMLTNLLPWLWMFPSMGFGAFGRAAPSQWMLLRSSFASHALFGLGIALSTRWLGLVGA
jgi:hypothetical protein